MLSHCLGIRKALQFVLSHEMQMNKHALGYFGKCISLIHTSRVVGSEGTPKIASIGPFEVQLIQGKRYSWCCCGYSKEQPFCDGQHRKQRTGVSPVRFKAEESGAALLCGCKQTGNPPFCDGSHNCDEVQNANVDK